MVPLLISLSRSDASARNCGPDCVALQETVPKAALMEEISAAFRGVFLAFVLSMLIS